MDYPYRLGEEVIRRGTIVIEVRSADNLRVFGTLRQQGKKGTVTAVSSTGTTLGHFDKRGEAAAVIAQWGVENVEGRNG